MVVARGVDAVAEGVGFHTIRKLTLQAVGLADRCDPLPLLDQRLHVFAGLLDACFDRLRTGAVDLGAPLIRFLAVTEAAFHFGGKDRGGFEILTFHVLANRLAKGFEILCAVGDLLRGASERELVSRMLSSIWLLHASIGAEKLLVAEAGIRGRGEWKWRRWARSPTKER